MPRRFLFFINPKAGTKQKGGLVPFLEKKLAQKNWVGWFKTTRADGRYAEEEAFILEHSITDVIIAGGDGTINQIVGAFRHLPIRFGLLPFGSGNGLALTAKIPANTEQAWEVIAKGQSQIVDGFLVNNKFACMLCGLGFDAQVAYHFAVQPKRGLTTYVKEALKRFSAAKPYQFTLQIDQQQIDIKAYFISIANSNQFGNQFTIAPKAKLNDGLLDVIIVPAMPKWKLPFLILPHLQLGKPQQTNASFGKQQLHYYQVDELWIDNPELAYLHIDGDPAPPSKHFHFRIIPNAFTLFMP